MIRRAMLKSMPNLLSDWRASRFSKLVNPKSSRRESIRKANNLRRFPPTFRALEGDKQTRHEALVLLNGGRRRCHRTGRDGLRFLWKILEEVDR